MWLLFSLLAQSVALAAPFAYISNGGGTTVSVIDTASNAVVATIPVGLAPFGVAVNSAGTRVYVANAGSQSVSVVDTATNAVVANVPLGVAPAGIAVDPAGRRVYTTNLDAKSVSVIDATSNAVIATVAVGTSPGGIAVNPAGTVVYVANGDSNSISVIDVTTNAVAATIALDSSPQGIAVNPSGTRIYVTVNAPDRVEIVDAATHAIVGSVPVGATPGGVALNPAGTRAYVGNASSDNVSVIDTATNAVVATVSVGMTPVGVAVDPTGRRVYVANFNSDSVSVIDTATNTVTSNIAVGKYPVAWGQFIGPAAGTAVNYQGLWWNAAESGWGVNFAHQGDQIFATWYTYDASGNPWWLSMLASRIPLGSNTYTGPIYVDTGPPFNNFVGSGLPTQVGAGSINFTDGNTGTFSYAVTAGGASNIQQNKAITRFSLGGAQPTCAYSANSDLNAATNYQDLWWVSTESGWGVNFAHQRNLVYATWYTYGANGAPLWLSALLTQQGATNVYTGPLNRTSGPRFDSYRTSDEAPVQTIGTATATFADGNHASFAYSTNGSGGLPLASQSKSISRFLFAAPSGTVCQ